MQSYLDYSLFTLNRRGMHLYGLIYVDDLLIGDNDPDSISRFKEYKCFHMKDLRFLKYFMGIEVVR